MHLWPSLSCLACLLLNRYLAPRPRRTRLERRVRQYVVRVLAGEGAEGVSKDTWNMVSVLSFFFMPFVHTFFIFSFSRAPSRYSWLSLSLTLYCRSSSLLVPLVFSFDSSPLLFSFSDYVPQCIVALCLCHALSFCFRILDVFIIW